MGLRWFQIESFDWVDWLLRLLLCRKENAFPPLSKTIITIQSFCIESFNSTLHSAQCQVTYKILKCIRFNPLIDTTSIILVELYRTQRSNIPHPVREGGWTFSRFHPHPPPGGIEIIWPEETRRIDALAPLFPYLRSEMFIICTRQCWLTLFMSEQQQSRKITITVQKWG